MRGDANKVLADINTITSTATTQINEAKIGLKPIFLRQPKRVAVFCILQKYNKGRSYIGIKKFWLINK
jgi:hypothetical protein